MGAPTPVRARKAQAKLEDIEPREVSPVDRPANGHPFLIVKSETGPTSEDSMGKATQKNTGTPPAQEEQMAQGQTPPAPPPALADSSTPEKPEAETPAEEQAPESADIGAALVLPSGTKTALVNALQAVNGRIGQLVMMLNKATEADGVEMPSEPIIAVADAAGALASCVEPYLMKQAGFGMQKPEAGAGMPEGEGEVGKAAFVPWTPEYIDSLSDWCFLYVEPSTERDNDWRSLPLSNRKFPVRDHAGRLCLPMVVDAINTITAGAEPFLSAQKKRKLLLRLAFMRLDEASDAAYRDEPMQPETAAELLAIAEMLANLGQMGAPAPAPAPVAPGETTPPAAEGGESAPAEQQMSVLAQKCAASIHAIVALKSAPPVSPVPVEKADPYAALKGEVVTMKTVVQRMEELMSAGEVTQAAPPPPPPDKEPGANEEQDKATDVAKSAPAAAPPPVAPDLDRIVREAVSKAMSEKDAEMASLRTEVTKAKDEVTKARAEITKTQADLAAKKAELAKAQRVVQQSNVDREESTTVAKSDQKGGFGFVTDLNTLLENNNAASTA